MVHRPAGALACALMSAVVAAGVLSAPLVPAGGSCLRHKTLVAWVAAATLAQRGGSALTLEDRGDHFDAIVFGELAPGKWMAGSDMFSRTQRDQSGVPAETAGPGTFVQIAIAYRGGQVAIYRDGRLLTQYAMPAPPREFGPDSLVLFGRRHRRQGDSAHFGGRIADARIYDRALDAVELGTLRMDAEPALAPWAWWTFDDPGGTDRTGRFPNARLRAGAHIEGGVLVLDGIDDSLLCTTGAEPPFVQETPAMPAEVPSTWLSFHLAHPGPGVAVPGDPNCASYWKGRYHLHYIYNSRDGFAFAHVSSTDLVHWRWHPTTLTPSTTGHGMFSGTGFYTREGRPAIIYHGQGSGRNQIAFALDDNLERWTEPVPVEPTILPGQDASLIAHWDPDAWLEGSVYYALSGGSPGSGKPPTLFRSQDLRQWDYLGRFLSHDMPDVASDEDISCPNFFRIGGRRMLLCISHNKGCRYYLGEFRDEKFVPESHHRMNWRGWDFFAPESLLTPDGRRVMWAWCHLGEGLPVQSGIQSLPRELTLPRDGVLRMRPLRELASLRADARIRRGLAARDGVPAPIPGLEGDTLEIRAVVRPGTARRHGLRVYADPTGVGGLPITVDLAAQTLSVGETTAPFTLPRGEDLVLRVFLDKSVVEVFANDRQAVVAARRGPPSGMHASLFAEGGEAVVREVRWWRMRSIYAPPQ